MWYKETLERKNDKVSEIKTQKQHIEHLTREDEAKLRADLRQTADDYKQKLAEIDQNLQHEDQDLAKLVNVAKEKEDITTEIAKLQIEVETEKKAGMIEINRLEREKIYAVNKLSEEMDYKVKETQANLMALNDEQLHTTTRLTILQNHQLTTELDY